MEKVQRVRAAAARVVVGHGLELELAVERAVPAALAHAAFVGAVRHPQLRPVVVEREAHLARAERVAHDAAGVAAFDLGEAFAVG